ncbi:MAG: PilZ domain-containing protein [Magnetococcales bacterium]|nr:PilZ domain-containing protein [Magnetococcales bacterium]
MPQTSDDNDGQTIAGSAPAGERRQYPRPAFHSESILTMDSGAILKGKTEDVSYRGIRFHPAPGTELKEVLKPEETKELGRVRISLNSKLPLDRCFVEFRVEVVRLETSFLGLNILPPTTEEETKSHRQRSLVYVRRSNGTLEPGWEILPQGAELPKRVRQRIRHHEHKYAKSGPVAVVCFKKGGSPAEDLFKLHNIQYLKEVQEFAVQDQHHPENRYDPPKID